MDINKLPYVKYCDLGILTLRIYSQKKWNTELVCVQDDLVPMNENIVNLFLVDKTDPSFSTCSSYREKVMRSGYYIGHHFGMPALIKWIDGNNIALSCEDPGRVIWSYIFKVVLTLKAQELGFLHIKGSSIEYKGRSYIVLGRGGSGKTEFVRTICRYGARLMGNTHTLIDNKSALGIKTNVRIREGGRERYISIDNQRELPQVHTWVPIQAIFWVQYRKDGINTIKELPYEYAYHNFRWFTEATGNWELKEDIADSVNSDPYRFTQIMSLIDKRIKNLCNDIPTYYLNLDIKSDDGREMALELLNTTCS